MQPNREPALTGSRRRFLGLEPAGTPPRIRPPWAVEEPSFLAKCSRCGQCVAHCPARIIHRADDGFPEILFDAGACTFCGRCVESCPSGALAGRESGARPWRLTASIGSACLALHRVECRVCAERCDARAITFRLSAGAVAQPRVSAQRCTGCGACSKDCPAGAVYLAEPAFEAQLR